MAQPSTCRFFGSASWYGKRTLVKLLTIIGSQTTGITWDGADSADLNRDPRYNPSGEYDMDGNTLYYPNETDNYWQRHYQLYVSHLLTDRWSIKAALNYTHGDGYYEQYKADKKFSKYAIDRSGKSDFVTRKQMDNNGITGNVAANYNGEKLTFTAGNTLLYFDGFHFGNVIWVRDTAAHVTNPYEWYRYNGTKVDNNVYAKATYDFSSNLNAYADLQLRTVNYKLRGTADDLFTMDFDQNYLFFNPKAGVNYRIDDHQRTYFVAGISNREPTSRNPARPGIRLPDCPQPLELLGQPLRHALQRPAHPQRQYQQQRLLPHGERGQKLPPGHRAAGRRTCHRLVPHGRQRNPQHQSGRQLHLCRL